MIGLAIRVPNLHAPTRRLFLPPAGRPHWLCPEDAQLDLLYLSWGRRRFGAYPIPVSLHPGWVYALVTRGSPTLRLIDRDTPTQPGDVFIIHPDCASGWADNARNSSESYNWVWRTGPRCPEIATSPGSFRKLRATQGLRKLLAQIHRRSRGEVEAPDSWTKAAIEQLRLELDVALARSQGSKAAFPPSGVRFELAIRWMAQNLTEPNPVGALCEYLQVSPITLNRLFHAHVKESASTHHLRLKMDRARQMLELGGASVKEVGFALGYRHANDFTRAMSKFTGRSPAHYRPRPAASPVTSDSTAGDAGRFLSHYPRTGRSKRS